MGCDSTMNNINNNRSHSNDCLKHYTVKISDGICRCVGKIHIVLLSALILIGTGTPTAVAYEVKKVDGAGSVRGRVHIGSAIPLVKRLPIFKNQGICGKEHRDIPLVQANGDGLLNAVVYLDKVSSGKPFPAAAKKITINQLGCRFIPHLSVMANAGEMEIINSDTTLHNIHSYEMVGPINYSNFSVSQPQRGDIVTKRVVLKRGISLRVMCDAHDFMRGYVFVARNPYYAVVNGDGTFLIDNIPSGTYTIRTWHGTLGEKQNSVTVGPNGKVNIDFHY
jgi:hypothetical protein